jgi:PLP dependent protein
MNINNNIIKFKQFLPATCKLIAVSKTHPAEKIQEAYNAGQRIFGENKVQELVPKHEVLPGDIEWHMIGHLQSNKVKYIAPFVSLIHSVDSARLLVEINKQAKKNNRIIPCLLQVHIAEEETKYGFSREELLEFVSSEALQAMENIAVMGLMGMATFTENEVQVRREFKGLKKIFDEIRGLKNMPSQIKMKELSMGMSSDYTIAIEEGSTMIRVGSAIFGERTYAH